MCKPEFPPLEGVFVSTETPGRRLEEGGEPSPVVFFFFFFPRMCVFLLSYFSLVAVNKAFYCGAVSADADTESGRGVPVPGPNPQTHRSTAEEDKVERGLCVPSERLHFTSASCCCVPAALASAERIRSAGMRKPATSETCFSHQSHFKLI